jgi:hypothetical protein
MKLCEKCKNPADVYAMGKYSGDWGGYYCINDVPKSFMITDNLQGAAR